MPADVTLDTSGLERGMRQLARGLDAAGPREGMTQAQATAARIRAQVPVRTGRLAATVGVVAVTDGGGVTYGGGLPYATYIERRAHAVANGTSGAAAQFSAAMYRAAATEVARL